MRRNNFNGLIGTIRSGFTAHRLKVVEHVAKTRDGLDLFGRNATGMVVIGRHPVLHGPGFTTHKDEQPLVTADEHQREFTRFTVRIQLWSLTGQIPAHDPPKLTLV